MLSPAHDMVSIKYSFITFSLSPPKSGVSVGKSFPCEQGPSCPGASPRGFKLLVLALAPQLLPLPIPFALSLGLCCQGFAGQSCQCQRGRSRDGTAASLWCRTCPHAGAAGLWQGLSTWGAPSWCKAPGGAGEGAQQGGGTGVQVRTGWDVIAEHSPPLEQAGRGLRAAAAFPGGVFFPAEIESQTWHWVTGPSRFFPGFHFHFQRVVPPGPSRRSPGEAGWPWRGSLSPPSALAPFRCAFPSGWRGSPCSPSGSGTHPAKLGGHCRATPQPLQPTPSAPARPDRLRGVLSLITLSLEAIK